MCTVYTVEYNREEAFTEPDCSAVCSGKELVTGSVGVLHGAAGLGQALVSTFWYVVL